MKRVALAALSGALDLPGFSENTAPYLAVKWIPPKWDWVDPLKDRKFSGMITSSPAKRS